MSKIFYQNKKNCMSGKIWITAMKTNFKCDRAEKKLNQKKYSGDKLCITYIRVSRQVESFSEHTGAVLSLIIKYIICDLCKMCHK